MAGLRPSHRLVALLLGLAGALRLGAQAPTASPPSRIPTGVLFADRELGAPELSPDGQWLAYLAPHTDGSMNLAVAPVSKPEDRRFLTTGQSIAGFQWAAKGVVFFWRDDRGDERFRLEATNLHRPLSLAIPDFQEFFAPPRNITSHVFVAAGRHWSDLYRIDLPSMETTLVTKNPGNVSSWLMDEDYKHEAGGVLTNPETGAKTVMAGRMANASFATALLSCSIDDSLVPLTLTRTGAIVLTSKTTDTVALVNVTGANAREEGDLNEILTPSYDIDNVLVVDSSVVLVRSSSLRAHWEAVDANWMKIASVLNSMEGDASIVSHTADLSLFTVKEDVPADGWRYHLLTRDGKLKLLYHAQFTLRKFALFSTTPMVLEAEDGTQLTSYFTPAGPEAPLVLYVHGGPWARDRFGYDPQVQWLRSLGYAVLQVNFRGSTGFGKKFLHSGDGQWTKRMLMDLIDAVNSDSLDGRIDRDRMCVFGASFGGFAALAMLAFHPDAFACGVDLFGPSDLTALVHQAQHQWPAYARWVERRIGNVTEKDSPVNRAKQIKRPLLIAQGDRDPRVLRSQSESIARHVDPNLLTYLHFHGEGHGFTRPQDRMAFYDAAEKFLHQHLRTGPAAPTPEPLDPFFMFDDHPLSRLRSKWVNDTMGAAR